MRRCHQTRSVLICVIEYFKKYSDEDLTMYPPALACMISHLMVIFPVGSNGSYPSAMKGAHKFILLCHLFRWTRTTKQRERKWKKVKQTILLTREWSEARKIQSHDQTQHQNQTHPDVSSATSSRWSNLLFLWWILEDHSSVSPTKAPYKWCIEHGS